MEFCLGYYKPYECVNLLSLYFLIYKLLCLFYQSPRDAVRFKEGKADLSKHGGLCKQHELTSNALCGHISFLILIGCLPH